MGAEQQPAYRRLTRSARSFLRIGVLGERDGWYCHLCGGRIDPGLPAHLHPMGPTADHLIPRSAGGIRVLANLALAHRACNQWRGNRIDVEECRKERWGWMPDDEAR